MELLDLIEAKAWRVNELVILTIHLVEVTEDVIEVLVIDIQHPFSNQCHSHVEEIRTSALRKMADSNLVYLLVRFNYGLKRDYGSKTRERKNSDTKDRVLVVLDCRMNVWIWRARVIKDTCLKKVG
jgi:hypothetical protein